MLESGGELRSSGPRVDRARTPNLASLLVLLQQSLEAGVVAGIFTTLGSSFFAAGL